ncbi:hypothetical protein BD779DRAFT_1569405 [Infundibulicybe gibba]|nr:hypothetical protein BD779DRAFT_1569405 [Infundibulicybe gibba]
MSACLQGGRANTRTGSYGSPSPPPALDYRQRIASESLIQASLAASVATKSALFQLGAGKNDRQRSRAAFCWDTLCS